MGGRGGGSGISAGSRQQRELTRKEQWMQNAGLKQSSPKNVKIGDSISTKIIQSDGSAKYEKWNFVESGTKGEVWRGTAKITDVRKTAKTTKITAKTPNGRVVTKTFKNSEDVFVFKKKKRNL